MDERQRLTPVFRQASLEDFVHRQGASFHEKHRILCEPPADPLVVPNHRSKAINRVITSLSKLCDPVVRPLFINMSCPVLKRDGRREKNYGTVSYQRIQQYLRARLGDVLGHFQTQNQNEVTMK